MIPDKGIREICWPSNGAKPTVYVPGGRREFGEILESQIQPASLDVRLGPTLIRHPCGEEIKMPVLGYSLAPGECILASLVETFRMGADNVVARVEGKSSWARRFLSVHSAGFIDPGFVGDITLELKNDGHSRIHLVPGVPIAQVSFQFLQGGVERMYGDAGLNSHYQYQTGPTISRQ
jgi:dCTP deaminase